MSSRIKEETGAGQVKRVKDRQASRQTLLGIVAGLFRAVMDSLWISDELFTVGWLV
jgi:hypothetical protein